MTIGDTDKKGSSESRLSAVLYFSPLFLPLATFLSPLSPIKDHYAIASFGHPLPQIYLKFNPNHSMSLKGGLSFDTGEQPIVSSTDSNRFKPSFLKRCLLKIFTFTFSSLIHTFLQPQAFQTVQTQDSSPVYTFPTYFLHHCLRFFPPYIMTESTNNWGGGYYFLVITVFW